MNRRAVIHSTILLACGVSLGGCGTKAASTVPPVPVSVVPAVRSDVPVNIHSTGTVEPIRTVSVQAQVNGMLTQVAFREGDDVKEGQIMFEIDPRPYQAALDQAQANLNKDLVALNTAKMELARDEELAKKEYIPQNQLDQARGSTKAIIATLGADTAAAQQARLNLQYATIRAPISGRTGALLVRQGNLVRTGSGEPMVVINQISPILVRFPVPPQFLDQVRRRAGKALEVQAVPQGDSAKILRGTLVFLDNAVDSTTATVLLKAMFANPDNTLWPGELVHISLQLDVEKNVLVVPAAAVQSGQSGNVIWTVDSSHKAKHRNVKVLRSTDSLAVLAGGVEPGEQVVVDGQLRLTDGARVSLKSDKNKTDSTATDSSSGRAKKGGSKAP